MRTKKLGWLVVFLVAIFAFGLLTNLSAWDAGRLAFGLAVCLLVIDLGWHLVRHAVEGRR